MTVGVPSKERCTGYIDDLAVHAFDPKFKKVSHVVLTCLFLFRVKCILWSQGNNTGPDETYKSQKSKGKV